MNYTLQKHLAYNLWANGKIVEIIRITDENIFEKEVTSSFPSLKKTICHIWDAEVIWLNRIKGVSLSSWPSESFTGSKPECLDRFIDNSKTFCDFFSDKEPAFGEKVISFKTMDGKEFSESIEGIVFHVVNHGSFHRGQLVTMLRTLEVNNLTSTDLIRYLRLFK